MTKNQKLKLGIFLILSPFTAVLVFAIYKLFEKGDIVSVCWGTSLILFFFGVYFIYQSQQKP